MDSLPARFVHVGAFNEREVIHKSGDIELIFSTCVVKTKGINILSVVVVAEVREFREHGDNVCEIHRPQLVDLFVNVSVIARKSLQ